MCCAAVFTTVGLRSWFRAENFHAPSGKWPSVYGSDIANVTSGQIHHTEDIGHGVASVVECLKGGSESAIEFGGVLDQNYTICTVSRYADEMQVQCGGIYGHRNTSSLCREIMVRL